MRQAILDFPKQFTFSPVVENASGLARKPSVIVAGMGGSHLAADILKAGDPTVNLFIHSDYGLPPWSLARLQETLLIASSYSGNTEETLDAYEAAGDLGMSRAVISVGGRLLEAAERDGVSCIHLPQTGVQPRSAIGLSLVALAKLLGRGDLLAELASLTLTLPAAAFEAPGRKLADELHARVPVIYASSANVAVAANWKIKINETGKSPAFFNVFPELNHNEMTGFDKRDASAPPSSGFAFVFLNDADDHLRTRRRMEVTAELYRARGYAVHEMELEGATRFERLFNSLLLADWMALSLAERCGLESEQVPMVEEFKKLV